MHHRLGKTQLFSHKLTRPWTYGPIVTEPPSFEWDVAFIQVVNEKLHSTESLAKCKSRFCIRMKKPLQKSLPVIPTALCSLLLSLLVPESCQGMMQTKFQRVIRPPSLVIARMVPSTETSAFIFSPHPPRRTIQFLQTEQILDETRFLYCAGDGKPLIPWEGNPWNQYSEVITFRVDSHHLTRDCLNIAYCLHLSRTNRLYDQQTLMKMSPFTNTTCSYYGKLLRFKMKPEKDHSLTYFSFSLHFLLFSFSLNLAWNSFVVLFGNMDQNNSPHWIYNNIHNSQLRTANLCGFFF